MSEVTWKVGPVELPHGPHEIRFRVGRQIRPTKVSIGIPIYIDYGIEGIDIEWTLFLWHEHEHIIQQLDDLCRNANEQPFQLQTPDGTWTVVFKEFSYRLQPPKMYECRLSFHVVGPQAAHYINIAKLLSTIPFEVELV